MKILIADDDPLSVLYMQDMLREWGFEVVVCADGAAVLAALREQDGPMLAILDAMVAGERGVDLCRAIRATIVDRYVYLIVLTSLAEPGLVAAAIEAGADDYIRKPFTAEQLRVRVRAGSRIAELEEQLRYRESRDALTGVYNRATIIEMAHKELARQARTHHAVALILCDIDDFKRINDEVGHHGGDEVLREAARRMGATLRPYDSLGRYGSEELLAVLPNCAVQGALEVAERMRAALAALAVATDKGEVAVTLSIGVATLAADQAAKVGAMLQLADEAMHRARQNGGNCITMAG
jgi:two-component system, cell cycle response regulator